MTLTPVEKAYGELDDASADVLRLEEELAAAKGRYRKALASYQEELARCTGARV